MSVVGQALLLERRREWERKRMKRRYEIELKLRENKN